MVRLASVLTLILTLTFTAPAQWVQTAGPLGGSVPVILVDGADIYAGTHHAGIFKSTDSGATWHQKLNGFGYQSVVAMAKCGAYLLASGTEGFYRSSDGGESWSLIPGFGTLGGVNTIAVQGTHAIAGTSYGGVYVSSDTGATWSPSNNGLWITVDDLSVPASTAAGSDYFVFAATWDQSGVFRSTDLGVTWTQTSTGLPPFDIINTLYSDGSAVFAAGTDVYKTTNMGANWAPASTGIPSFSAIWAFASNGSNLFGVGSNGMYTTTNNGTSWSPVTGGLPVMDMKGIGILGTDIFAGTIADGIYKSADGGVTWSPSSAGIRARDMTGFIVDGNVLYGKGKSVFRTTDDGNSWNEVRGDLSDSASMPRLMYAAGDTLFVMEGNLSDWLSRSTDGGLTWTRVWPELFNIGTVQNIVRTGSGFWTAVGSIYRSTDIGATWSTVDSAGTSGGILFGIERLNGELFAFGQRVYRSTDDGSTWADVTPASPSFVQADMMTAVGSTLFIGDRFSAGIWRSTNGGSAWGAVPSPAIGGTIDQLYGSGSTLLACSEFTGIFRSTNDGTTWSDITPGLPPGQPAYWVTVNNGYLFAGIGGNSVWRRPMSEITTVDGHGVGLPVRTTLVRNYPNPFNPSTTIAWEMASVDWVVLKVYDVLGREVATLFDGVAEPGSHSVSWEAGGLPGGVYYCRMTAGSSVETKAMMLMR